jgi:hypothetical protein
MAFVKGEADFKITTLTERNSQGSAQQENL